MIWGMFMIEFFGEWNEESKNFIITVTKKWIRLAATLTMIMTGILFGTLSFAEGETGIYCRVAVAFCLTIYIIAMIFPNLAASNKKILTGCPYRITIEDEKIVCDGSVEVEYYSKDILDVKKVLDYGSFYYIKFYFRDIIPCLCQKDLIVKGTIEEFEELFADRLVRKIRKTK